MEKLTMYKANDGRMFGNKKECEKHDKKLEECDKLVQMILPKAVDTCDFANGGGYIQLTLETKNKFMAGYVGLIRKYHPKIYKELDVALYPTGMVGRYLCDADSPFYRLWTLAGQIDFQDRLWGQSYFVTKASEAKQVCLGTR